MIVALLLNHFMNHWKRSAASGLPWRRRTVPILMGRVWLDRLAGRKEAPRDLTVLAPFAWTQSLLHRFYQRSSWTTGFTRRKDDGSYLAEQDAAAVPWVRCSVLLYKYMYSAVVLPEKGVQHAAEAFLYWERIVGVCVCGSGMAVLGKCLSPRHTPSTPGRTGSEDVTEN